MKQTIVYIWADTEKTDKRGRKTEPQTDRK